VHLVVHTFILFFNSTTSTMIYTLSLHDALPIFVVAMIVIRRDVAQPGPILGGMVSSDGYAAFFKAVFLIATALVALLSIDYVARSEEHTSELQSRENLVCRLLLEKKNSKQYLS